MDDEIGSSLYISSRTGEVVQTIEFPERLWNWFGAVPHWLYYTSFRRNLDTWYQVVVWISLTGAFLVATGLYVG